MNMETVKELIYLVSAVLFILSLMWMSHPSTARRGIVSGVVAMLAAAQTSARGVRWDQQSYWWISPRDPCQRRITTGLALR